MQDRKQVVLTLRAVAALAEKLAAEVEGGRLWEGDFNSTLSIIRRHVASIPSGDY